MNQENQNPDDAALSRVLREWKVKDPLPPRFQEQVWRRIEHREEEVSPWVLLARRIGAAFTRPSLAVGYVSALLIAGLAAGYWQAQVSRTHAEQDLGARYVQMVDPYQRSHH